MKRIFLILLFMSATVLTTVAHNAKIATFVLRDTGAGWFIEMHFARAAVDAVMIEKHGRQKLEQLSKKAYQRMVVDYVKSNFHLKVNGEKIGLGSGGINLGAHQTDLKFVLPELPFDPRSAQVYIPMFGSTYNHTNLFRIYRGGKNITKFFLSEDNDFKANMNFTSEGIMEAKTKPGNNSFLLLSSGGLVLGLLLVLVLLSRKKLEQQSP